MPRGGYRASPFRTPGVPPLPDTLALSRAMRPLRLRVPSHVERVLDEDETVRRIAEQDLWAPAHRPRREPWLDVILVVDDFETMVIWRPAVDALERLLRRQRAFRQVRRVRLREGGEDAPVPAPRVTDGTGRRSIALAEVFLGGLIERDDLHLPAQQRERDPQRIRFEFRFDIRRRLLNTLPDTMVEDVIDALSEVVERRLGRVSDFIALMLDPSAAGKVPLDSDSLPFARVRLQVLRRLSGDYAPLADALEDAIAEWHDRDGAPMALPTDPTPFREPFKDGSGDGPEMIWLPGGTFRMGSPEGVGSDDEHPAHDVTLSHFGVGKYPLTVGEFRRFATAAGYKTEAEQGGGAWVWNHGEYGNKEDASWRNPYMEQDDRHPVVCISWNDAKAYCEWLSRATGQTYALLTEAQWEYACRAGSETAYCFGDDETGLAAYAWFGDSSESASTHPVGEKKPNAWDLHDIHGNVWEWCADWYAEDYYEQRAGNARAATSESRADASDTASGASKDPSGPESGSYRVIRGGSWYSVADLCRSAYRYRYDPGYRDYGLGFRLSRTV